MVEKLVSAIVAALIAAVVAMITINITKMDSLDGKSGWRKKLMELASKDMMTLDDVYLLRATLRYSKHEQPYERYSFKYMSNEITGFCEQIVTKYVEKNRDECNNKIEIEIKEYREIIRIYARYLLKNHWEVYSSRFFLFSKEFKIKNEHKIGKETYQMVRKELKKLPTTNIADEDVSNVCNETVIPNVNGYLKYVSIFNGLVIVLSVYLIYYFSKFKGLHHYIFWILLFAFLVVIFTNIVFLFKTKKGK